MSKRAEVSTGEALVGLLEAYGVDTIFGIPGVHNVEMYRALPRSKMLGSENWGRIPGLVLGASAVFSALVFDYAFVSVWCFFAAAASVVILCHLEWSRRRQPPRGSTRDRRRGHGPWWRA